MATLTGTKHGDAANQLLAFYKTKALELEAAGQFFMAAVALTFALETAILTFLLVEFGEDNGGELAVSAKVGLGDLINEAIKYDVLDAPIDTPSHVGPEGSEESPEHRAKDAAGKLRQFRNLIHPANALREGVDPRAFTSADLKEKKAMFESVMHSLI
ncbi:MAG: hypothetical protein ACRD1Y_05880, partial [Terriglobales bacterium]